MVVAIGCIIHESNSFSPVLTDIEAFYRKEFLLGEEVIHQHWGKKDELGGFLSVLTDNADIIPVLSAIAMPAGLVTPKTYAFLLETLLTALEGYRFDALLLALHGSMCVEGLEDPEGDILSSLRATLPNTVVIGCTLDHHANVTEKMVDNSDFLVGYRTHPHVDQYDVGREAAQILLANSYLRTVKQFVSLPMVTKAENRLEPIVAMKHAAEEICAERDVVTASFFVGYPWADVSIMGASTYVLVKENTQVDYAKILADKFWSLKDQFSFQIHPLSSLPALLSRKSSKPIVLNELSDCTFGGSSGDAVATASYLIQNRVEKAAVVGIVDPETVERAFMIGAGNTADFSIGGKRCIVNNPPLKTAAEVVSLHTNVCPKSSMQMESDMVFSRVAVLKAEGVYLMIIEYAGQIGGPAFFDAIGLSALDFKIIVVKEGLNPFVTYKNISDEIVMIDSPGFNPQRLTPELYHNLTRKLYPIHSDVLDQNLS